MLTGINGSTNNSSIAKLRDMFPDKTKRVLAEAFVQLIHYVYNRESDKAKILSNHNSMNLIEFKIATMKRYKDRFLFSEIKDIFLYLDVDRTGRVLCDQFVTGIRGTLSEYRQRIVNFVFYRLDKNTTGFIEEPELIYFFSRSVLADAASRESYAIEKSMEFIRENGSCDKISLDQFTDYYLNKSLITPSDAKFKSECIEEWRVINNDDDVLNPNTTFSSSSSPIPKRESTTSTSSMNSERNSERKSSRPSSPAEPQSPITPDSLNPTHPIHPIAVESLLQSGIWSSSSVEVAGDVIPIALDSPLVPCRPSEKSVKRPARFLRQGSSESIASVDPNFSHAPTARQEHSQEHSEHSEEGSRNSSPTLGCLQQEEKIRCTQLGVVGVTNSEISALQFRSVLSSATTASGTPSASATVSETAAASVSVSVNDSACVSGTVSRNGSRRGSAGGGAISIPIALPIVTLVPGGNMNAHDSSSVRHDKHRDRDRGSGSISNGDAAVHPNVHSNNLSHLNQHSSAVLDTTQQHGYFPSIPVYSPISHVSGMMDTSQCDTAVREHQLVLGRQVRQLQCKIEEHDKTLSNQDIIIRQQKQQIEILQQKLAGKII